MGDCWDYRIKKVDIAWQIAQKKEKVKYASNPHVPVEEIKGSLVNAWQIVDDVLPGHVDPTKE